MAYQKQRKNWQEQEERKRKEREAFRKLSSQEKIERLMKYIDELEQKLENHTLSDVLSLGELEDNIDKRFRALYVLLRRSEATDDQSEELASLRSFGPVDLQCPECHRRAVIRKRSDLYSVEYLLECMFCHWRQEFKS